LGGRQWQENKQEFGNPGLNIQPVPVDVLQVRCIGDTDLRAIESQALAAISSGGGWCLSLKMPQANDGPPGQAIKDGRADPSDFKRHCEASF
jgi:hypothetical protein